MPEIKQNKIKDWFLRMLKLAGKKRGNRVLQLREEIKTYQEKIWELEESICLDESSKYILFSDNSELSENLPDNVLVLSPKFKERQLWASLEKIDPVERNRIELWLLRGVLKAPVLEDIITVSGDSLLIGGRKMSPQELIQIRSEVKVLKKMRITRLLDETIAENARQVMFKNAKSIEDIKFGKTIIYLDDLKKNIFKLITRESLDEKMKKIVKLKR